MAIVRIRQAPNKGTDDYDAVTNVVGDNNLPAGMIAHTAGEVDGGFQVIDIWESEEAADRFEREQGQPLMSKVLGEEYTAPEPKTYELHNLVLR